ncbi:hypothetical protein C7212DRAFT_352033 [Tuber magnatum]|uniref:Uncharacterized protein n=1 Tax=Tuber magnatum TaxID=42249 RepID=A0A317SNF9_9PEZI|nr:hypothetical protein C7212DRAFT_352033 [Tuber magnatum]
MGNQLSSTPSEGLPSSQLSVPCGGTTGFANIEPNRCDNHRDTGSSQNGDEILEYLSTSKYHEHRNRIPTPVEGKCTWVTKHSSYTHWLEEKTSGLLWLSAEPGRGKSVIASFLVSHLSRRPDTIEQKSSTFALRAILHQLFTHRESLRRYAEPAFNAKGKKFADEVDTLWEILVQAVAEGGCGDVICVVDALDECEEGTLASLVHPVNRLLGSPTSDIPLKFIATSRPYDRIRTALGSLTTAIHLEGENEASAIRDDINRVIDQGIKNLESSMGQPRGLEYLRSLLVRSPDRTFLWVSLVLEILDSNLKGSPEELTKIGSTDPHNLPELYTKILGKITDRKKALRVLKIVVVAKRPLTLWEINAAFRIREQMSIMGLGDPPSEFERTVKRLCGLFVRVINSKIYLVHKTAKDFLIETSLPGGGDWQYTLCPIDSNFTMADICITYLAREDFGKNPVAIDDAGSAGPTKYALLNYAASHWVDHFRDSEHRHMELFDRSREIFEPGSARFLTWLGVYWESSGQSRPFPEDFTHLMLALWLRQGTVVDRLLEDGRDVGARSKQYGTALNIAALRNDKPVVSVLLERNVGVYIGGRNEIWYAKQLGGAGGRQHG